MKKHFLLFTFLIASIAANAQPQAFGKVDVAELELRECSFEKDANAMVLFDKADVYFDSKFDIVMERHKRIKVFNTKGKGEGDVRIEYYSNNQIESIYGIQAQTVNLVNGKPEIIKIDRKLIYTQAIDKNYSAIVFSFPNVQAGSVLEFKYTWKTPSFSNFPDWQFQKSIPVKYSEFKSSIPDFLVYRTQSRTWQPYLKNVSTTDSKSIGLGAEAISYNINIQDRVLADVPSLTNEPYMSSLADNLQSIQFQLTTILPLLSGFPTNFADSWAKVGSVYADDEDFGLQIRKKLTGEEAMIIKAKSFKEDEQKIAYLFNEVKNAMQWDGQDKAFTNEGTQKAWEKKTGNSTEINLILCHLLKQTGVTAFPMLTSTRDHGKVSVAYPSVYQFNKAVVFIPVDSTKNYILDATDKFGYYNQMPKDILNSHGLYFDKETKTFGIKEIGLEKSIRESIMVDADVQADGKIKGKAQISSDSYHKSNIIRKYKVDGAAKYQAGLNGNDNLLKIESVSFDNMEIDSLPLMQNIAFELNSSNSEGDYVYFNTNLFSNFKSNPFLSENRYTDIDFGFRNNFALSGNYKIPAGFKIEALPKSVSLNMHDNSITFKRMVGELGGAIVVRYTVDFKKSIYSKDEYVALRDFYKKMTELLNEQLVLKKS